MQAELAQQLSVPRAALSDYPTLSSTLPPVSPVTQPFTDPDPFHELTFPSAIEAKRAIADRLGMPLAKLTPEQLSALNGPNIEKLSRAATHLKLGRKSLF